MARTRVTGYTDESHAVDGRAESSNNAPRGPNLGFQACAAGTLPSLLLARLPNAESAVGTQSTEERMGTEVRRPAGAIQWTHAAPSVEPGADGAAADPAPRDASAEPAGTPLRELVGAMFTTPKELRHLAERELGELFVPVEVLAESAHTAVYTLHPGSLAPLLVHAERAGTGTRSASPAWRRRASRAPAGGGSGPRRPRSARACRTPTPPARRSTGCRGWSARRTSAASRSTPAAATRPGSTP